MEIGFKTDKGLTRTQNEDSLYISENEEIKFFIVADGMGGHVAGKIASTMATEIISQYIYDNFKRKSSLSLIKSAIQMANAKIYLKSLEDPLVNGMGTTVTMLLIKDGISYIAQVGDSRAYLINKNIKQITTDHSYVEELIKIGCITSKEAKSHPKRNLITRAVGSSSILEVDLYKRKLEKNDIFLLLTDGITNVIEDEEIEEIFKKAKNLQKSCDKIIKLANDRGGIDNSTIIAVKYKRRGENE